MQAGFASLVLILLPLAALRTRAPRAEPAQARPAVAARWRVAVYFLALGFGFMFIEISFIHRFTTFLGHPLAAIAVVLAAFLIFAGLGSGIAAEIEERRRLPSRSPSAASSCSQAPISSSCRSGFPS